MDEEIWRDIPGFEGAYQVSNLGRVRSLDRLVHRPTCFGDNHYCRARGQLLRPNLMPSGHCVVTLGDGESKDGSIDAKVHALVLLAFVGPYPEGLEIRHLNGIPSDNRLVNLEYGTHSQNQLDIKRHGGKANSRLTPQDVFSIKRRLGPRIAKENLAWGEAAALAREYDVSHSTISDIWRGHIHKDIELGKPNEELGGGNGRGRLAPRDILSIFQRRFDPRGTGRALAREYGVTPQTISKIWRGHVHRNICANELDEL